MSSPPQSTRRSAGDSKKNTPSPSNIVTRNGARKAKIQTRAMSSGAKPSTSVLAAKKKAQQRKKQTLNTTLKDPYHIAMESKHIVKGPVGLVTDPRMLEHKCLWDDTYPECPERLSSIIDRCKELGLLNQCVEIPPREATKEELLTLHSPSVYDMMETTHQNNNLEYLEELSSRYDAVYIHPSTHKLALSSVGSTIELVSAIVSGSIARGAALVRPPGHHAMRAEPCGYCFYNNVALAAKHAIEHMGVNRVLIVDWDVHHGQATQQMFYDDPRVVYFSIHRYEHGAFWPNLRQSDYHYTGSGRGLGYNFNVPLNKTGMGDADYLAIWNQLLLPMAFEYQPELIIISAGYDAAVGCPEGEMQVTPSCYGTLLHLLSAVTSRIAVVLEGGYCLRSLAEGAAHTLRALLGHPPAKLHEIRDPTDEIRDTILNCIYAHKPYWSCYNYQQTYSIDTTVKNVCDREKQKHTVTVKWEGDEHRPDKFETRDCYPVQDAKTRRDIAERLDYLQKVTDISLPQHEVGYVYDEAMLKHENICEPDHVESPSRVLRIHSRLLDYGVLARTHRLTARPATDHEILAVHTADHLKRLKELSSTKLRDLNKQKEEFDSVYFHPDSFESAAMAVGCVIEAVDSVLSGELGSCACAVRPPGHHACARAPKGFCLLNTAAAAAARAVAARGRKVLVLDWDVHHGNGTQDITYEDDQILYISIHRYDGGSFFPNSTDGNYDKVGKGKGEGFNVNIPWNKRGMGDVEYLAVFTQIVLPIAYEYNPDLVIVSAGFDACVGDPLGGCKVTPECYGRMTQLVRGLAGGKVVLCLEGGYNVTSISYAMTMCVKALLGDPINQNYDPKAICHWSAIETINSVINTHKKYWKSLKFQLALPIENVLEEPLPSRGLTLSDDRDALIQRLSGVLLSSLEDKKDELTKSIDTSIENAMSRLAIELPKCEDGIHCGTDDEDDKPAPSGSKAVGGSKPGSSKDSSDKRTLVDYLAENMQAIVNEEMFAVIPIPWCPHLEELGPLPADVQLQNGPCVVCQHSVENWICLHCYHRACARSINAHMEEHHASSGHSLVLSLSDLSVWCYVCDSYVDNERVYAAKNSAHRHKFGEDMPWCYHTDSIQMQ